MSGDHRIHSRAVAPRSIPLKTDSVAIERVLHDAAHVSGGYATALAQPTDLAEVIGVVKSSATVLAIGSQSSLTGGATPRGETVLEVRGLRGIERVDAERWRVGAGLTLDELQAHLARHDAFYPPVPAYAGAQIGGAASTNAAGPATFKYGSTRQWIDGLTVVLADGSVLELERGRCTAHPNGHFEIVRPDGSTVWVPVPSYPLPAVAKLSAGYYAAAGMDLVDLFIGSEGTLGVITEVIIKTVTPAPLTTAALLCLSNEQDALELSAALRSEGQSAWRGGDGIDVCAIEFIDAASLDLIREDGADRAAGLRLPDQARAALIVQRESLASAGPGAPTRWRTLLEAAGATVCAEATLPGAPAEFAQIMGLRAAVPLAVNARIGHAQRTSDPGISKVAADMIVPFEHLSEMIALFRGEFSRLGLPHAIWGHISDGNLHPNALPTTLEQAETGQAAILRLGRIVTAMAGSPLAEHGVGRNPTKQALLRQLFGEAGVAQMRAVKTALDPGGKLAPGVIFPAR